MATSNELETDSKSLEIRLLPRDRIVSINGINLSVTKDYRSNRRNVICTSKILETYTSSQSNDINLKEKISELKNSTQNDIVVVSIAGFH